MVNSGEFKFGSPLHLREKMGDADEKVLLVCKSFIVQTVAFRLPDQVLCDFA